MWSFPIVSLALGLLSWKRTKIKYPIVLLCLGLGLQSFAYSDWNLGHLAGPLTLVALGKGLLAGLLFTTLSQLRSDIPQERSSRMEIKIILLLGLVFLTLSNLTSPKLAEGALAIFCIIHPAIFWKELRKQEAGTIFSAFSISVLAFFSFLLTWSEVFIDKFDLSPLLWMVAFSSCFYLYLKFEEAK